MRGREQLSARDARWLAIDAQGLSGPRRDATLPTGSAGASPRARATAERRAVRDLFARIGTVQLDAVNVLQRTQFLVLFSRLGAYDIATLHRMGGRDGDLFEYWGHAASLMPASTQPLFRWRMAEHAAASGGGQYSIAARAWRESHAAYIAAVLEEVRDRGPLAASGLSDPRRQQGEWWDRRSTGRRALEWLFSTGQLAAWRTPNFERVYDLPERVFTPETLTQPTPARDEAHRALLMMGAQALGVATAADLGDYFRIRPRDVRPRVAELVESGALVVVDVEGWAQPAYCLPDVRLRRPRRTHGTLLSPFDSLIWDRGRTERLFGFDYRIEVYVPAPRRRYGYYVLPLLLGDRLVARLDLKADRRASALRVQAAHLEPGSDPIVVAAAAAGELDALRRWLGLDSIAVASSGDLAPAIRKAVAGTGRPATGRRRS